MAHKNKSLALVINAASGSSEDIRDAFENRISQAGWTLDYSIMADPEDIEKELKTAIDKNPDILVTFGGDGTALCAVTHATARNIPVAALPGGTMNVLPRLLYGSKAWEDAAEKILTIEKARYFPAGYVGKKMFLVGAILGSATHLSEVRETLRHNGPMDAITKAMETLSRPDMDTDLEFRLPSDDAPRLARVMNILCPGMSDEAIHADKFDVAALSPKNALAVMRLGVKALLSDWRMDPSTFTAYSDTVELLGSGTVHMLLDGEPEDAQLPVRLSLKPDEALFWA